MDVRAISAVFGRLRSILSASTPLALKCYRADSGAIHATAQELATFTALIIRRAIAISRRVRLADGERRRHATTRNINRAHDKMPTHFNTCPHGPKYCLLFERSGLERKCRPDMQKFISSQGSRTPPDALAAHAIAHYTACISNAMMSNARTYDDYIISQSSFASGMMRIMAPLPAARKYWLVKMCA